MFCHILKWEKLWFMEKVISYLRNQSPQHLCIMSLYNFPLWKKCQRNSNWSPWQKSPPSYLMTLRSLSSYLHRSAAHCLLITQYTKQILLGHFLHSILILTPLSLLFPVCNNTDALCLAGSMLTSTTKALQWFCRISGAGFLLLSGMGTGSFGRRLSFLVMIGFTSIESVEKWSWRADGATGRRVRISNFLQRAQGNWCFLFHSENRFFSRQLLASKLELLTVNTSSLL